MRETQVGGFGFIASALLATALGLAAFCGSCFAAIVTLLLYNQVGGHSVDLADSYKYVALPVGMTAFVVSVVMLGVLRVRSMAKSTTQERGWKS